MNAYNIIKTKLTNDDYEFDINLLSELTVAEFEEINSILITEVSKGNSSCYKYIKFLKGLDVAKLMSTAHKQSLTEDNWIILATNVYLVYPKPSLLEHIVEMARVNSTALEQLKIIAQLRTDIIELPNIIQNIESQKKNSPEIIETTNDNSFEYYRLEFGAIVKVKKDQFLLYRLDPKTNQWVEDHEMFMEMAQGSYHYEPITINDTYPNANALDQSKGIKL